MSHPYWPLFDLEVTTPRLTLRVVDDDLAVALATLAARGVHDPNRMPFCVPWTDLPQPELERGVLRYHWRCRAETEPGRWVIPFAVFVDGSLVGTTELSATDFATLGQFETGSWLGREFHGLGIGTEMRVATLTVGFVGLGAEWATTSAFDDNPASLGVTRKLGYEPNGVARTSRRSVAATQLKFRMSREHFDAHVRQDDIELSGIAPVREFLGTRQERADPSAGV